MKDQEDEKGDPDDKDDIIIEEMKMKDGDG